MNTNTALDHELGVLRRLSSHARSMASRIAWRTAMQVRMARISGAVRAISSTAAGVDVERARIKGGWQIVDADAATLVARVETCTPGRTAAQLLAPIPVHIHDPARVNLERLQRLERDGKVHLIMDQSVR